MYFWHKQYALWSMLLLLPHILLAGPGSGAGPQQAAQLAQTGRAPGIISALGLLP